MARMRWIVAIVAILGACGTPTPNKTVAPAVVPNADAPPPTTASERTPLSWHTVDVGGTQVEYATIGEPREGAPVLLALPPGPQTREMVAAGLERWADAIANDGWFVLSPVSPNGLFHTDSADLLPRFVDTAAAKHGIPSEGLAVFGMSNGGLSAFALAIIEPRRVRTLVTMPGRPTDELMGQIGVLKAIPVTMIVGADDSEFWVGGAQTAKAELERAGGRVSLQLLPDTGHAAHLEFDWDALRGLLTGTG